MMEDDQYLMFPLVQVRSWRILGAEPSGALMWFDPSREIPMIRSALPPGGEDVDGFYEGGALEGTLDQEEGVPRKGGETKTSEDGCDDLPF